MNLKNYLPKYEQTEHYTHSFQFTIFIPVYNSAKTLHRVFGSLNAQSFTNFEVIIINDGSSDNSDEVIRMYLSNCPYHTTYLNNAVNKHKMGCLLEAINLAKGEFFIILDSDDECTPDALQAFYEEYINIPADLKTKISGITCCCVNQHGDLIGDRFPKDPFYSNSFEKKVYYNIRGEKWGFNKTEILKSIKVDPALFGKGLIPESYLWFLIAKMGYTTKYINRDLRIYYIESTTNLSSLGYDKKAFGMVIFAIAFVNWFHQEHLVKAPKHFLMRIYSLLKASKYLGYRMKDYVDSIDNYFLKIAVISLWPFRAYLK